jgi:hypothetical protein
MFSRGSSRPCSAFPQKAGLLEIEYEGMTVASQRRSASISKFELVIRIPLYVRRLVRRNEAGLIGLAVAAGRAECTTGGLSKQFRTL